MCEIKRMNDFFEKNFSVMQEDNKAYVQENSMLRERFFRLQEKMKKKNEIIKTLRENEAQMKETLNSQIKEKDEQIERLMKIFAVLPEVYLQKLEEKSKIIPIPHSFHNNDKSLDKERKILRDMYNNIESSQKNNESNKPEVKAEKTGQKSLRSNVAPRQQKKLSWWDF